MPIKETDPYRQKAQARYKRLGLWAISFAICGVVFLAAWFFVRPLPSMRFHATASVQSVSFRLGSWPDSAGIFNSDIARINLIPTSPVTLHSDDGSSIRCSAGSSFMGVRVVSMSTAPRQNVSLEAQQDGLLHYALMPEFRADKPSGTHPEELSVSIQLDEKSNVRGVACEKAASELKPGIWRMTARSPGLPLEFSIDFTPAFGHEKHNPASSPTGPEPEREIPLADDSSIQLRGIGENTTGSGNQIQLLFSGRHIPFSEGLALEGLHDTSIAVLSYRVGSHSLDIDFAGVARKVKIKSGGGQIQQSENHFGVLFPEKTAEIFTALATFFGAAASMAAVLFGWIQHRERMKFDAYLHAKSRVANHDQSKKTHAIQNDQPGGQKNKSEEM
ncbi:MAG TPA: hypothetical protein VHB45_08120 [Alloacidobacterium sp.]|nr:hypothetical protein [Alloacidobacterium sp.]